MLARSFHSFILLLKNPNHYVYLVPGLIILVLYIDIQMMFGWLGREEVAEDAGWWESTVNVFVSSLQWIGFQIYQFFMITLLSPVMALLGEKADNQLSGASFDGGFSRMMNDLWRAILIALTAFFIFGFAYLFWVSFAWIAGIGKITPFVLFFINAFFIGFAYMDYALERYRFNVGSSWGYAFKNWKIMVALGVVFSVLFLIPYLGALLAPFVATLAGTAIWYEKHTRSESKAADS